MFIDRPAIRAAAGRALKLAFEFGAGFHQPAISQWEQKDGIDLRIDEVLTGRDETEGAGAAAENWNRLFGVGGLCGGKRCGKEKRGEVSKQHHGAWQGATMPAPGRGFSATRQQRLPHLTRCKNCRLTRYRWEHHG